MIGGTRVYDPICDGGLVQRHGAERVGDGLLVPVPSPQIPHRSGRQLAWLLHVPRVDSKWRQVWRRGRLDLLRLIAEGGRDCHHGLRLSRRLLPEAPGTRSHLDRAGPWVEGGPRCVGTLILGVAAVGAVTDPVAATIAIVVVLLLVGLLRQALLLLLLLGGACRPTGRGWHRQWLGHGVERGGGNSGNLQPLGALLNFLQAEVIMHLLERREGRRVREDGAKVIKVLVQPTENVQDEEAVRDVNAEVDEGVNGALHLQAVVIHVKIALNKVLEGGIDVEGVSFPVADEAIL
jgi:hypothetical protein